MLLFSSRRKRPDRPPLKWIAHGWRQVSQWLLAQFRQAPYGAISLAIALVVLGSQQLGLLESLELSVYDYWVRQQSEGGLLHQQSSHEALDTVAEIVIVGITEEDIQNQAQWPLSDQVLAELLDTLQQNSPRAIGIDLHRDIAYPPGEVQLAEALQADNIFVIESLIDGIPPPPDFPVERVGFNDLLVDSDGIVRRNFFYATLAGDPFYSLSLKMALALLDEQVGNATQLDISMGNVILPTLPQNAGGYSDIDNAGYQLLLQYHPQGFQQVSLTDVLSRQADSVIKDNIVFIGTVAPSIKDTFFTPFSPIRDQQPLMPGVEIHAHNLNQLLTLIQIQQPPLQWVSVGIEGLWILCWSLLGGSIAWYQRRPLLVIGTLSLTTVALVGLCGFAFSQHFWLVLAAPAVATFLSLLLVTVYKVFYYSFYDPMTRLPNRTLFLRRLQPLLQRSYQRTNVDPKANANNSASLHAVLFVDIDGFKSINESLGQEGGNQVLCQVARRLQRCLPNALMARVGGDEFAILLPNLQHSGEATDTAAHVQKLLAQPDSSMPQMLVITVSIGIALQHSGSSYRAADLLQDAHRATHRARQLGRERYEVFARGMRTQAVSQFQLEMDLRVAIEQQAFELYYQPIICLKTGYVAGFEALIRWPHEERGFVSPGDFIPLAEETGLIIPLGQWILETACQQAQHWHQAFPQQPPLAVSVNLSGRQFNQSNLVEMIQATLSRTQLTPCGLKLELTESIAMENVNLAIDQLLRLKQMGLQLSLDDFGTGYSSLSYLHRFSIDTLKVDRSFVSHMDVATEDSDIVKTILSLGHQLGMTVVAEGIETAAQLQALRQMSCDYGQGYLFAKPLTAEQASQLLQQPKQW